MNNEQETILLGIVGIKNMGDYDSQTKYEKLNVVTYQGGSYCALKETIGNLPTDTEYWQLYAEKGDKGETGEQGPKPVKGVDYYTAEDIETIEDDLASSITNEVTEQLGDLVSATPLAASSVADMVDTTRIYVNTTDGKWYYYDGDSWEIGGIYQSTSLGDDSVSYNNLDSDLKNIANYERLNKKYNYLVKNKVWSTSSHRLVNADGQNCLRIPANKSYLLRTKGSNILNASRDLIGAYSDGEDGENYIRADLAKSFDNYDEHNPIMLYNIFDTNRDYSYYYIPSNDTYPYYILDIKTSQYDIDFDVYEFDSINNIQMMAYLANTSYTNYGFKNDLEKYFRVWGYPWWSGQAHTVGSIIGGLNNNTDLFYDYDTALIPIESGETKYIYTNQNFVGTYDKKLQNFTKLVSTGKKIINGESYNVFEATGSSTIEFITAIKKIGSSEYKVIITDNPIVNTNINSIDGHPLDNNIPIKKWITLGDSITNKNYRCLVNYVDWCCKDLNIINENYAVSSQGYKQGNDNFIAQLDNVTSYDATTDILTVMGSINDINHFVPSDLGELGDTTTDTVYGAMYVFFDTLFTKFNTVRVGAISPLIYISAHQNDTNLKLYNKALKETCELFNVPFLDISNCGNLRPWDSDVLTKYYTADGSGNNHELDTYGVHPNSLGHQLFYGRIREFIKSL